MFEIYSEGDMDELREYYLRELDKKDDEIERLRAVLHWTAQHCQDQACVMRAIKALEPAP